MKKKKNDPLSDISCSPAKFPAEPRADRKQRDTVPRLFLFSFSLERWFSITGRPTDRSVDHLAIFILRSATKASSSSVRDILLSLFTRFFFSFVSFPRWPPCSRRDFTSPSSLVQERLVQLSQALIEHINGRENNWKGLSEKGFKLARSFSLFLRIANFRGRKR